MFLADCKLSKNIYSHLRECMVEQANASAKLHYFDHFTKILITMYLNSGRIIFEVVVYSVLAHINYYSWYWTLNTENCTNESPSNKTKATCKH